MPAPARAREERMRDHGGVCALWSWVVLHRAAAGGSGLLGLPLCGLLGLPLCGAVGTAAATCLRAAAVRRLVDRFRITGYYLEAWLGFC